MELLIALLTLFVGVPLFFKFVFKPNTGLWDWCKDNLNPKISWLLDKFPGTPVSIKAIPVSAEHLQRFNDRIRREQERKRIPTAEEVAATNALKVETVKKTAYWVLAIGAVLLLGIVLMLVTGCKVK